MKKKNYILYISSLIILLGISITSCDDVQDEITELNLARYLKVMNVKANSLGGIQVRLDWDQNKTAEGYVVEFFADDADMNFEGEASVTIEDLTNIDLPYTLTSGLDGNTVYAIRVKAVGEKSDDSLWSDGVTVRTAGEQLLYPVANEDITHESAIVRWQAGETATHLIISGGGKNNEEIRLSPSDISAGEYEITDLSAETTYTVTLMNGTKQRGSISFTTGINIGDAVEVKEEDDFLSLVNMNDSGTIFYFSGNSYNYGEIEITKSINIVSGGNTSLSAQFKLINGASITLQNIILDGLDTLDAPIVVTTDDNHGLISITNSTIKNYKKRLIDSNTGFAVVASIIIDNCIVTNIAGSGSDFIDFRSSKFSALTITNSTFYNIYPIVNRDFLRADHTGNDIHKTIIIDHCTFNDVISAGNRLLYVRGSNNITFTNNILTNSNGYFNNQADTKTTVSFSNNVYFNADLFMTHTNSNAPNDVSGIITDPQFADPANGDFTLTGNLQYESIGDPRWY